MFIRKKKNSSRVISIQVIDKSSGKYRVKKTIGSSAITDEIERLVAEGEKWIEAYKGAIKLDLNGLEEQTNHILDNISHISICGIDMLLGKVFDEIGFNKIPSTLFRLLVFSRLENPVSKLKTTDYWLRYHD
jgi:hypothetical protein